MYETQEPSLSNKWLGAYKCSICKMAKWSNLAAVFAHNNVSLHGMTKEHGIKKRALEAERKEEWAAARNTTVVEGAGGENAAADDTDAGGDGDEVEGSA